MAGRVNLGRVPCLVCLYTLIRVRVRFKVRVRVRICSRPGMLTLAVYHASFVYIHGLGLGLGLRLGLGLEFAHGRAC